MPQRKTTQSARSVQIVTGVALGSIFLYAFTGSLSSILVNEVVEGFSLSGASEGLMSSMFSLGTMLALLVAPLAQGRITKMNMILLATLLQAGCLVLCGASPLFPLFCGACVVLGVSCGLVDTYANSSLIDARKEESVRYLGYLHGLYGVGSLLAPLLLSPLTQWAGWRSVFFVLAACLFVGAVLLILIGRRVEKAEMDRVTQETVLRPGDIKEYAQNPRNIALLLAAVFATATQTGLLVWVVRYMSLRFDAEALGMVSLTVYWVCATVNRFGISHIRMAPIRLFVAGTLLSALCLGAGVLCGSAVGMCVAMGALGLCTGHFSQVLFSECTREYAGKTTFPTSALMVAMGLARSVVPLLMASVSVAVSVPAGMLIPGVAALAAALAGFAVMRMNNRLADAA